MPAEEYIKFSISRKWFVKILINFGHGQFDILAKVSSSSTHSTT